MEGYLAQGNVMTVFWVKGMLSGSEGMLSRFGDSFLDQWNVIWLNGML